MKVIGISGLPGSGKSFISKYSEEKGYLVTNMGDVIREEAKKRGEDTGTTATNLRLEHGQYVVAKFTIEKVKNLIETAEDKENLIIVEGIRSPFEVELFKEDFPDFTLLSVFASPETRFQRITSRGRGDDTQDINAFRLRDKRELDFGIGNVIATSDYIIVNETTFDEYNKKIDEFFDKILNHETIYLQ
ncbi:MAG: AAA family ATPase [Methanobacteriaceae archaeon]|nr:AAA family ATPase [Methanobacteriaceae archaeon]